MSLEWILDESKFLTEEEIKMLRRTIEQNRKSNQRDSFIINLAMSTGLCVQEIVDLKLYDIVFQHLCSYIIIRRGGKGGKPRFVYFNKELENHILEYLEFKKQIKEPLEKDSPLVYSKISKGHITKRGIQEIFKKYIKLANISKKHSIHHLRHTYALELLRKGADIRFVKDQLGHSSPKITATYLSFLKPETNSKETLGKLYK